MKRKRCSKWITDLNLKKMFERCYKIHGLKLWISFYWLKNWSSCLRYRSIQSRYWNTEKEINFQYQRISFLTFCSQHSTLTADLVNELFQNVEPRYPPAVLYLDIKYTSQIGENKELAPCHVIKCSYSKTSQSQWELCMLNEMFKYFYGLSNSIFLDSYEYQ